MTAATTTQEDIDRIVNEWRERGVVLRRAGNVAGYDCFPPKDPVSPDITDVERIDDARAFLRQHAKPTKGASSRTVDSFAAKRGLKRPIANGEFIIACALEGFSVSFRSKGGRFSTNARLGIAWRKIAPTSPHIKFIAVVAASFFGADKIATPSKAT